MDESEKDNRKGVSGAKWATSEHVRKYLTIKLELGTRSPKEYGSCLQIVCLPFTEKKYRACEPSS